MTLPDDAPWPWAMVRDNITGLIWEVKTDDGSIHDKDNTYNRSDAQDVFIAGLNSGQFGGHSDWRLPTVKELVSIVNRGSFNPAINTAYFPNTQPQYHWSSTPDAIESVLRLDRHFRRWHHVPTIYPIRTISLM